MAAANQINESELGTNIRRLKGQRKSRPLVNYIIGVLASGQVPLNLQAKAYNELGLAHLQLDEPLEAEKSFIAACERDPAAVNPRFNRANLALYAQKYSRALEQYLQILELDPEHVGARYHAGLCLALTSKPAEALPYFEMSAGKAPEAMGPAFWAGETLLALGEYDRALPYLEKAAAITPDHRESRRGIAICRFEMGEYEACVASCDALILSGGEAEYLAVRIKGDACIEMGDIEAAARCHASLALMDFDARDYLVMRARDLSKRHPDHLARYVKAIVEAIPELERAFAGLVPVGEPRTVHQDMSNQ